MPQSPWEPDENDNVCYLIVDARSRYAALKSGAHTSAIDPFHQQGDNLMMNKCDLDLDSERHELEVLQVEGREEDKVVSFLIYLSPASNY